MPIMDEEREKVLRDIQKEMDDLEGEMAGEHGKDDGEEEDGKGKDLVEWAKEEEAEPEHKSEGGECGHMMHGGDASTHHPECPDHPYAMGGGMHRAHGGEDMHHQDECPDMADYPAKEEIGTKAAIPFAEKSAGKPKPKPKFMFGKK